MPDVQYRTLRINGGRTKKESRTVEASLSSEAPVPRGGYVEILDHRPGSVDLSRAVNGALPLLASHDPVPVPRPGNVERIRLAGRRLVGLLRFARNDRGEELWQAVRDGTLGEVSVGYEVLATEDAGQEKDSRLPIVRVTRWRLLEVSLVNLPADATVGIGRSMSVGGTMSNENRNEAAVPEFRETDSPAAIERDRVDRILAIAGKYGQSDLARQFIRDGRSAEEFGNAVLDRIGDNRMTTPDLGGHGGLGLSRSDRERYSIRKAILALVDPEARRDAGFELEVSREAARSMNKKTQGILIPFEVLAAANRRDILVGTNTMGGYLVQTDVLGGSFIDILRNASVTLRAGAVPLGGLSGNVSIPKKSTGATAYWVAEGTNITESSPTFGQVAMTPKTMGGLVEYTRKFLLQSSMDAEQLVRQDLAELLAVELDRVAITGTSTSNEPTGIRNTASVGSVAMGTNGGAPTWAKMVEFLSTLGAANAMQGRVGWVTNSKVMAKLLQVDKGTNVGQWIWEPGAAGSLADGMIAGYPAFISNNVPSNLTKGTSTGSCSAILYGNWSEVMIGQWGALELMSDPYTAFASGNVRIRALLDCDVAVRHPESFVVCSDALTT